MAMNDTAKNDTAGAPGHGAILTGAYVVGLLLVFAGQRLVGDEGLTRTLLDGVGAAICGGALVVRLLGRARTSGPAVWVETLVSALYGAGLVALGLYWISTPGGLGVLGLRDTPAGETVSALLGVIWVAVLVCVLFTLLFVELSYAGMPVAGAVEHRRVAMSGAAGLTLGLALTYLVAFNYAATEFEWRRDLTYFKTSTPSEATERMVKRLDEPVDVVLFYPESNEVLEQVRPYFDELARSSKNLRVKVVDHVLAPRLAKEHRVRGNGHVLVSRGAQGKTFQVGLELEDARRQLKQLDATFQENLATVTQPERVFYTTVGHGERTTRGRDQAEKAGIEDLAEFSRRFGLEHRNLGMAQGLGNEIPADASVVAVLGPDTPFLPEEVSSLVRYVEGGGRLLLLLEPDTTAGLEPVLEALGLKLEPGTLAHDQLHRLLTDTSADRGAIISNRYSPHPASSTVSRAAKGVATVFYQAGHLSKRADATNQRISFLVKSMPGTWADRDGDLELDPEERAEMAYNLGAAVTLPVGPAPAKAPAKAGQGATAAREGRAVVIADADVFSDRVFRNEGNLLLAADSLLWLVGEEGGAGLISSEEDEPIEHTRGQDSLWFWTTVVLVPALVMGFGLVYTARRRRRQGPKREGVTS
jgi:hypothetical protein